MRKLRTLGIAKWCAVLGAAASASAFQVAGPVTPRTERVDVPAEGAPGEFVGLVPAVSADGRYVAFASNAALVPADTDSVRRGRDVFVRDRVAGTTTLVSAASDGRQVKRESDTPAISGDGRHVAFASAARLTPDDRDGTVDVFVHDRVAGTTTRVSQGAEADFYPAISAGGRFVAFAAATDEAVFVHDRRTGRTTRAAEGRRPVSISADGRYVGFGRWLDGPGDRMGTFVRDRRRHRTERVDVSSGERAPRRSSRAGVIAADGRSFAFVSEAGTLVPGDDNGGDDVFVRDLRAGTTTRVSVKPDGKPLHRCPRRDFDGFPYVEPCADSPAISADGRYVAFRSQLRSFGGSRFGGIFVHDRQTASTTLAAGGSWEEPLALSGDGRYLAFGSGAGLFAHGPLR